MQMLNLLLTNFCNLLGKSSFSVSMENVFQSADGKLVHHSFDERYWIDVWHINLPQIIFHLLSNTEAFPQINEVVSNQLISNIHSYMVIHEGKQSCLKGWIKYLDLTLSYCYAYLCHVH